MKEIAKHPILPVEKGEKVVFKFGGKEIEGEKGLTIAAALHRAGFPVHSHSIEHRNRSLECGIGKCGACEMLVDGKIRRICITPCDTVKEVKEIGDKNGFTVQNDIPAVSERRVYRTKVVIVGAGPAGLAVREQLQQASVETLIVDANDKPGGQFLMQTHAFFFFEKEKRFGGRRGFDIAKELTSNNLNGIFFHSTVWDLLEGKRLAMKDLHTNEVFFIDAEILVVATGAIPFMPTFGNDDLPGVYTAAVVQKMMNQELTLLGKNILTVGAGNIGYLTSYQLEQAGAKVKAIIEAQPHEGGFPVQANRVRRLGIPILTSYVLVKAVPNANNDGITGAIIAKAENFKPIPGTEQLIDGIDVINICTGLVPDDTLLIKGKEVFGRQCYAAGDTLRIGEGTSAVLRGKQVAYEILDELRVKYSYNDFLAVSKEYVDSQQHPVKVLDKPNMPDGERKNTRPFVITDCTYGFACNPCAHSCPHNAISKSSTSTVPVVDYTKCIGCMECVTQCPGLAIFGYQTSSSRVFLPYEFILDESVKEVNLVNNEGESVAKGIISKVFNKPSHTNLVRIDVTEQNIGALTDIRGFKPISKESEVFELKDILPQNTAEETYVCHCDDIDLPKILNIIGDRKIIAVDEIKHTTRLGMGPCRGKRCISRLRQLLTPMGISLIGGPAPRGPMSNLLTIGELYPSAQSARIIPHPEAKVEKIKVHSLVAGGGMAGSSLFRYLSESGLKPVLINSGFGSSWRNIGGGRLAFSLPELADIARHNLEIFDEVQSKTNVDLRMTHYVNFAHDEETYKSLEASMQWQDAYMIGADKFTEEVSPYFNTKLKTYQAALISKECWQATPGKVIEFLRNTGIQNGGRVYEDAKIIDLHKNGKTYILLVQMHDGHYVEFETEVFVNALGSQGGEIALKAGYETGIHPVRHQAFITRRLPWLGVKNNPLDMLIDRRIYKGFLAVYGQQFAETGQIIGCASPLDEGMQTDKSLKINSQEFYEIVSEVFTDWIPSLSSVSFQTVWSGYYAEPRMIIDPDAGLFLGLRGHGFMFSQYLAKIYVDKLMGRQVPSYMNNLSFNGNGLSESAFK